MGVQGELVGVLHVLGARHAASLICSTAATRPGRAAIVITRSDRTTASAIEWVTKTTVVRVSLQTSSSW